jgi:disulfide bond formation protein DsbB
MRINITLFLLLFSVLALAGAYTSQYVFGMEPCILCLYQRIPYFFVILLSTASLFVRRSQKLRLFMIALCGVALVVGGGIAFFHVGVESGKFSLTDGCDIGSEAVPSTLEEMTTQLLGKPNVPCDKPQFVFLGLSMAAWNFLFSTSFGFITLINVFRIYQTFRYLKKSDAYRDKK